MAKNRSTSSMRKQRALEAVTSGANPTSRRSKQKLESDIDEEMSNNSSTDSAPSPALTRGRERQLSNTSTTDKQPQSEDGSKRKGGKRKSSSSSRRRNKDTDATTKKKKRKKSSANGSTTDGKSKKAKGNKSKSMTSKKGNSAVGFLPAKISRRQQNMFDTRFAEQSNTEANESQETDCETTDEYNTYMGTSDESCSQDEDDMDVVRGSGKGGSYRQGSEHGGRLTWIEKSYRTLNRQFIKSFLKSYSNNRNVYDMSPLAYDYIAFSKQIRHEWEQQKQQPSNGSHHHQRSILPPSSYGSNRQRVGSSRYVVEVDSESEEEQDSLSTAGDYNHSEANMDGEDEDMRGYDSQTSALDDRHGSGRYNNDHSEVSEDQQSMMSEEEKEVSDVNEADVQVTNTMPFASTNLFASSSTTTATAAATSMFSTTASGADNSKSASNLFGTSMGNKPFSSNLFGSQAPSVVSTNENTTASTNARENTSKPTFSFGATPTNQPKPSSPAKPTFSFATTTVNNTAVKDKSDAEKPSSSSFVPGTGFGNRLDTMTSTGKDLFSKPPSSLFGGDHSKKVSNPSPNSNPFSLTTVTTSSTTEPATTSEKPFSFTDSSASKFDKPSIFASMGGGGSSSSAGDGGLGAKNNDNGAGGVFGSSTTSTSPFSFGASSNGSSISSGFPTLGTGDASKPSFSFPSTTFSTALIPDTSATATSAENDNGENKNPDEPKEEFDFSKKKEATTITDGELPDEENKMATRVKVDCLRKDEGEDGKGNNFEWRSIGVCDLRVNAFMAGEYEGKKRILVRDNSTDARRLIISTFINKNLSPTQGGKNGKVIFVSIPEENQDKETMLITYSMRCKSAELAQELFGLLQV